MAASGRKKLPGFYVAHHPWLDTEYGANRLYKVGYTEDLRRRLFDGEYTTAFTSRFTYVHTFETHTKEDAHRLEAGVLYCANKRRAVREGESAKTELLRMEQKEIALLMRQVAKTLGIVGTAQEKPVYGRPPRAQLEEQQTHQPHGMAPALLTLEELTALAAHAVAPEDDQLADFVEDLLASLPADDGVAAEGAQEQQTPASTPRDNKSKLAGPVRGAATLNTQEKTLDIEEEVFADELMLGTPTVEGGAADGRQGTAFDALDMDSYDGPEKSFEARPYQATAISTLLKELAVSRRAILQMACRCGKTRVAHGVIQDYLATSRTRKRPIVLYLVPGLALLRQTVQKLDRYKLDAEVLLVGSDERPLPGLRSLRPSGNAAVAGTTDSDYIRAVCEASDGAPLLVVSTYQSSSLLPDVFDLSVFDESHRVCGAVCARPFTHVLLDHKAGDRLYMTATPRYDAPLSMKDRTRFGGVAFAYHMRKGMDAGYVNVFSLELVGRKTSAELDDKTASAEQIVAALERLNQAATDGCGKLLVFCRSICHAESLRREVEAALALREERATCLSAHSRMPQAEITENLARFCTPSEPGVLFNCRLFQEGVELPTLNGVFFATPRHSPRDIIQSLCRPLTAMPGKPPSKIFIPVAYDPAAEPDAPSNLASFTSIIPYFDALVAEDPLLYEHLLDPLGKPYPLEWVESAVSGTSLLRYKPAQMLSAARRSVRRGGSGETERLLRAAKIPWDLGFGELQRIVQKCGRYPKTTDFWRTPDATVNFSQFYKYVRTCFAKWQKGQEQPLEPYQINALASLPKWVPYGVEGPYPWRETLESLEQWLSEKNELPPLNINSGGYVGLEATPLERLSGTLTCVNQSDGRDRRSRDGTVRPGSGFTLDATKQKDLDALCARWGLQWRKERRPAPEGAVGSLVENAQGEYVGKKTFIQEAYARFKQIIKTEGWNCDFVQTWYPGFPYKHQRQERDDVWARKEELLPPRRQRRGKIKPSKRRKGLPTPGFTR
ncbi:helicase-like protein [Elysia marginata]|uniref:Probable helicase A859L n=1 Tax=Elysia marginata TaxID=1093978 RepID=A0AAV4GS97_9GAST|nr:helicase-like protein [Elysia marginata]